MKQNYVNIPRYTTLQEIRGNGFSLSATQYKEFRIKNSNMRTVSEFLDRKLERIDLGCEVGSGEYVDSSDYMFIKTKALQRETYLISERKDATEYIRPDAFVNMNLKQGELLISKDSNVGEIAILDRDYPNAMLCGGIYRLPVSRNKYYLLAFIKSDLFRQQIDFIVPRGATIRHGKTKFLECKIPWPNRDADRAVKYVELLVKSILSKEKAIRKRYRTAMAMIQEELERNQNSERFVFNFPSISEIQKLDRMDSALYDKGFKAKEFLIHNYRYGCSTVRQMGFQINRGQNLQVSNIGKSIQTTEKRQGYYTLILPKFLSKYGTVEQVEYVGNANDLKILNEGDIIFGAEGNEKGRSYVVLEARDKTITNIHGIILNQNSRDITKSIFVKVFLDYCRANGMIDAYAVGGNGGSMAIKYWDLLKFPDFPPEIEKRIAEIYHYNIAYEPENCTLQSFPEYDDDFNDRAGIYELDQSIKYLQDKLNGAICNIANDVDVETVF